MRSHKGGETRIPGFLEDYAAVALGFIALYEQTFDDVWVARAQSITESMIRWFWDDQQAPSSTRRGTPSAHHASARYHGQRHALRNVDGGRSAAPSRRPHE